MTNINIRVNPAMLAQLKIEAKQNNITLSDLCRQKLTQDIKKNSEDSLKKEIQILQDYVKKTIYNNFMDHKRIINLLLEFCDDEEEKKDIIQRYNLEKYIEE